LSKVQCSHIITFLNSFGHLLDGKTHSQIDHNLIDKRWHSNVLYIQLFRGADCDTDHCVVMAIVRETLAVSKQTTHRLHMEVQPQELNEVEDEEQCHVEISNRFTALENLGTEVNINRVWETVRENIKISAKESLGYYELKKHKPWLDKGCPKLYHQRKQAKLQWLQDPRKINRDNLQDVKPAAISGIRGNICKT
jgi:hypothetical protein